jgi:predicted NBD/HSP70 family sugar kinase
VEVNFFRVGNGGSMLFAGIDIGSRTIELVVVDEAGEIKGQFSGGHRL